ncbi:exodeoxyribonuclease VII small subunit [Fannyhessea vaginae]|uniref:exodeoxyribonuclease VII small subunit n=1 Tax=Fannyhessea vaginae TaxID=82135 RepID=UPI0028899A94|nr:exodeoxyribonuclease VII small subunit [Fannyhessea vaginae]
MAQLSSQDYTSFTDIKARLEQIITSVKDKEVSLENSLDLFDEAIKLGSRAVDMVDAVDLDDSELLDTDTDTVSQKNTPSADVENDTSETDTSSDDTPVAASSKNDTSVSNELESSAKDTASSKVQPNSSESEASQHGDVQVPVLSAH